MNLPDKKLSTLVIQVVLDAINSIITSLSLDLKWHKLWNVLSYNTNIL